MLSIYGGGRCVKLQKINKYENEHNIKEKDF